MIYQTQQLACSVLSSSQLFGYVVLQAYPKLSQAKCSQFLNTSPPLLSNVILAAVSVLLTDASPWQSLHEFIHCSPQHQRGSTHSLATPSQWTCISPWPGAERVPAAWSISVLCLPEQPKALPLPTFPSSAPLPPSASLQSPS